MIVNLQEVLAYAEQKQCAIGAFNTPNFECIMAVIHNAEKFQIPVIIEHAQVHESVMPLEIIGPAMVEFAKKAKVPVCVHLDHGESLEYIEKALELGFSSAMYDGSKLSFEENVENTRKAVAMVRKYNAGIEAEIGVMQGGEAGGNAQEGSSMNDEDLYTDPQLAYEFVKATGIDALAASFGTVHGFYKAKPKLDFERIENIKKLTGIPVVMHGGSGLSPDDYKEAIRRGVRKINYYSYMSKEALQDIRSQINESSVQYFHDIANIAVKAMENNSEQAMRIFYGLN